MGKRSRLLGTVGLLAAVAAIVFVSFQRETSLVKRLEDGSFLRIASVEFGNHHKYTLPGLQPGKVHACLVEGEIGMDRRYGKRGFIGTAG
jgi:hypothetical protein